jgi:hypothetical protein
MQKTAEYLSRAAECRDLARSASPSRRKELEHMAATYQQLAEMRKRRFQLSEKLDSGSDE